MAVVFPGDTRARATWSGTPKGLAGGLEELGVTVVPVRAEPPRVLNSITKNLVAARRLHRSRRGGPVETLRFGRAVARISPELAAVRTTAVRKNVRRAGDLDGIVQIGTGYSLEPIAPIVTFEDITIALALRLGYPEWEALSERAIRTRLGRQQRAYDQASACCLTTHWAAESVIRDYCIRRDKVHVVGVGRNHNPRRARRTWSPPRFLFVGRDWEGKNGPGVLRAFARLRREIPEARLDVVGEHPRIEVEGVTGHGPLRLGGNENARQVERLFQSATCFVLPSHYEASAIAYVEAAAAGLPSIGTTAGGSATLIGDGGLLVDPRDDGALLAAMRELAEPETAVRLGSIALRRSELFTWRAVAGRVLRALGLPDVADDALAEYL